MSHTFLNEAECYKLLQNYGIKTPRFHILDKPELNETLFEEGEEIVLKAVVNEVWHKSDSGLIKFAQFSPQIISETFNTFFEKVKDKKSWQGMLVCEKVSFQKSQLPIEMLLSIKTDPSCGPIVTIGFGGIHTELWGSELKKGVLNFSPELSNTDSAYKELSEHLLGKILLGEVRQGKPLTSPEKILALLSSTWKLAREMQKESLSLIEVNPLVLDSNGEFVALDGVGETTQVMAKKKNELGSEINKSLNEALFNPKTFLIAGVSSKKKAFGNIILDNFKNSIVPPENISVLKKDCDEFEGFKTITAIEELVTPIDALILAVPAKSSIEIIKEVCASGMAKIIYLVAGGIGDGADHSGLKEELLEILDKYPVDKRPRIIGPNSLGIILSHKQINTLFIPEKKLPVRFYPNGNIGLIAQSGAFFITRISRNDKLPIRFGFCIGNQIDISATDLLQNMATDKQVDIIALYLEGAPHGDALSLAKAIREVSQEKKIVIYRGGRSPAGMKAASGHTGALASDYSIEKKLLQNAGAIVCENFSDFENNLAWYSSFPHFEKSNQKNIAVISNAGYESVASADGIGHWLTTFSEQTKQQLVQTLDKHNLSTIVSPNNPLDITPMANDDVYYECASDILRQPETDVLILGIVPLSVMIETENSEILRENVSRFKNLIEETGNTVAVVVDAGLIYKKLKDTFADFNIPLFNSIQDVFSIVK